MGLLRRLLGLGAFAAVVASCGNTDLLLLSSTESNLGDAGDGAADAPSNPGDASAAADGDAPDGACVAPLTDPLNCGQCGHACGPGQSCSGGACVCPRYEALCNGLCVPVSADAANCGGCNVHCTGALACSAGVCAPTCMAGLDACSNACVDLATDDANCGACGTPCPVGTGCVDHQCASVVGAPTGPTKCVGGGPPVVSPAAGGGCLGELAQTSFRWTICSCKDAQAGQALVVDAYDSSNGPYAPGAFGGGVGANGKIAPMQGVDIGGAAWSAGAAGISIGAASTVRQDLRVGGPVNAGGSLAVVRDAFITGNVGVGSGGGVSIAKTLYAPATATIDPKVTYSALVRQPVVVRQPCDCSAPKLVPVAAMIAAQRPPTNDNVLIGLAVASVANPTGPLRVDLPCGAYYLLGIASTKALAIVAHGRTALFVDGDVASNTFLALTAVPGSELDVFVGGAFNVTGALLIGSPNFPAAVRVYVGGSKALTLPANARVAANVYAAAGPVKWTSTQDAFGAVFAGDFSAPQATAFHYDRSVLRAGDACPKAAGSACSTCGDCGNQACVAGVCGACGSTDDCCSPLVCLEGRCEPSSN